MDATCSGVANVGSINTFSPSSWTVKHKISPTLPQNVLRKTKHTFFPSLQRDIHRLRPLAQDTMRFRLELVERNDDFETRNFGCDLEKCRNVFCCSKHDPELGMIDAVGIGINITADLPNQTNETRTYILLHMSR